MFNNPVDIPACTYHCIHLNKPKLKTIISRTYLNVCCFVQLVSTHDASQFKELILNVFLGEKAKQIVNNCLIRGFIKIIWYVSSYFK